MNDVPAMITNFFLAMQAGPSGLSHLGALFALDAVYFEPFSGQPQPHRGRDAILAAFDISRTDEFDDAVIQLVAIEVEGPTVTVEWVCHSKAIPGGRGSGTNTFGIKDGLITDLTTTLKSAS